MYPPSKRLDGGVLYSRLAGTHSGLEKHECGLTYERVKSYICRVVGILSWVLINSDRRYFSDMKTRSSTLIIVISIIKFKLK